MLKRFRSLFRSLVYRPFSSPDAYWRKRTRWGEYNEFLGHQLFVSDRQGYNPPFITNPFHERREMRMWADLKDDGYEYIDDEKRAWADRVFGFVFSLLEHRIPKDAVIFDVGCNSGYQLQNFHKLGFEHLYGIDPMSHAIAYGRKKRPYIHFVEGFFGDPKNDVACDVLVCFGSIFRVPYGAKIFDAIDRCSTKYVLIWTQEASDDFNRDPHVGLAKRGFICIEKRCVSEDTYTPIGYPGADGPMITLGSRGGAETFDNFRSFFLFRRVEPRPPAPKQQPHLNKEKA